MEESGRYSYIEVLFGANSIGEFLSLIDDIGDIMRSDKELENSYREAVADLKAVKAEYEEAKAEMESSKQELEALKVQQEKDIAEAAAVISSLQSDISSNSAFLSQLSAQEKPFRTRSIGRSMSLTRSRSPAAEAAAEAAPSVPAVLCGQATAPTYPAVRVPASTP